MYSNIPEPSKRDPEMEKRAKEQMKKRYGIEHLDHMRVGLCSAFLWRKMSCFVSQMNGVPETEEKITNLVVTTYKALNNPSSITKEEREALNGLKHTKTFLDMASLDEKALKKSGIIKKGESIDSIVFKTIYGPEIQKYLKVAFVKLIESENETYPNILIDAHTKIKTLQQKEMGHIRE